MLNKTRIAVFVSGGGTNLQALIDAQEAGAIPSGELALVISSKPDAYALKRAEKHQIPTVVANRKELSNQADFEKVITDALKAYQIDMIVLAGFLSILSRSFIVKYPQRIINVHPSLIPAFCGKGYYGLRVHEAVLARGVKLTGATVHYVNEIPDGGEIILQKAVTVRKYDTPDILQQRVMTQAEWLLLPQATELVANRLMAERERLSV